MRLKEIASILGCDVVCGQDKLDIEVGCCYAADMMSDVLAFATPHCLLITGLSSVQSVHTADLADCSAIVLVAGKRPAPDALQLALARGVTILSTPRSMYDVCGVLSPHVPPSVRGMGGSP